MQERRRALPHPSVFFLCAVIFPMRWFSEPSEPQGEASLHRRPSSLFPAQFHPAPPARAATAPRTIVATSNTSATPTILAARREMQQWRFLALEPSAMRKPDRFQADPHISEDGGHVPATLNRLVAESEQRGDLQEDVYAIIASRVAQLVPITSISVNVDEVRKLLTLVVIERSGVDLPFPMEPCVFLH